MPDKAFEQAFRHLIKFFDDHSIEYVLIGAWANNFWGRPRGTADIDFLVLIDNQQFNNFKENLIHNAGLLNDEQWDEHNPIIRHLQARFRYNNIPVDIMLPRDSHDKMILKNKQNKRLLDMTIFISSREDTILQKIKIGRPRDFEDAASILEKHKETLDRDYLSTWANKLNVQDKLSWLLQNFK